MRIGIFILNEKKKLTCDVSDNRISNLRNKQHEKKQHKQYTLYLVQGTKEKYRNKNNI